MEKEKYLTERVYGQLGYLDKKAAQFKSKYFFLKTTEIALAGSVAFVSSLAASEQGKGFAIAAGLMGVLIVIFSGIRMLYHFQENWISYRKTAEALKRELIFFETAVAPYDKADAFKTFVQRIESITAAENGSWEEFQSASPDVKK